jgi:hypothetical protein
MALIPLIGHASCRFIQAGGILYQNSRLNRDFDAYSASLARAIETRAGRGFLSA